MTKKRIVTFLLLLLTSILTPLPVFAFCAFLYILVWSGEELLILAIIIDAVFGIHTYAYAYTLVALCLIVFGTILRPHVSWYTEGV